MSEFSMVNGRTCLKDAEPEGMREPIREATASNARVFELEQRCGVDLNGNVMPFPEFVFQKKL